MEPILSKFESQFDCNVGLGVRLIDEVTSVDVIHKSTLLRSDALLEMSTRATKVQRETTDDE